nr:MAG TPA: hypothetical protein [Caudoviricetes sp.]
MPKDGRKTSIKTRRKLCLLAGWTARRGNAIRPFAPNAAPRPTPKSKPLFCPSLANSPPTNPKTQNSDPEKLRAAAFLFCFCGCFCFFAAPIPLDLFQRCPVEKCVYTFPHGGGVGLDRILCAFRQCNRNPVQIFCVPLSISEFARFRVFLRCRSYHPPIYYHNITCQVFLTSE